MIVRRLAATTPSCIQTHRMGSQSNSTAICRIARYGVRSLTSLTSSANPDIIFKGSTHGGVLLGDCRLVYEFVSCPKWALPSSASAASHHRIARGRDWLEARAPAEEVLIIGATLGAANEVARSVAQTKGASFGYHRMTLGQLASTLARPASGCATDGPTWRAGHSSRREPSHS